ncbi:amidohydrolase family protein [Gluconacetobacter diazotrophicus]|uniref:Putative amidohydrolases n=1 Tax=Gluconacetobacter diazotrophicus (strain ATCC 49037 / DSM 5601 / CCUG 37298 / CIP 103539 / LMG 7603 / PAl5) TaxID=272568 RepID=A9HPL7_GLUDA|nr:amidohydrolase family protein [Gluconacetobacter diazotrophicus]CAP56605.1 putative amidohydrolases [Gluconacetobacter diazotrophicus PA1 5]
MKIDAHRHVWRRASGIYGWLPPHSMIDRDFDLDMPRPGRDAADGIILVQAAASEIDTGFMLDQARAHPGLVRGVVGWAPLDDVHAPATVARLAAMPLIVGLRPMLQDIGDTDWILGDAVQPALYAMTEAGLVLDLLVTARHMNAMRVLAERHPGLTMVLDHAGKPPLRNGDLAQWKDHILDLSDHPAMNCKLSGLVTEAGDDWSVETLRPVIDHVLACFGPRRVMWGSDWPVVEMAGGYDAWRDASDALLASVGGEARAAIEGGTAARAYRLAGR